MLVCDHARATGSFELDGPRLRELGDTIPWYFPACLLQLSRGYSVWICLQWKSYGFKVPWRASCMTNSISHFSIIENTCCMRPSPTLKLILCCLVVLARRAIFVIENPHGSLIYRRHRFEYLTNMVAYDSQLNNAWVSLANAFGSCCNHLHLITFCPWGVSPAFLVGPLGWQHT